MSYGKMLEMLKEENKDKIVLVQNGAFYIAIAEDAIYLHEKIGLKNICFKQEVCKVGVPINSIEKYLEKLEELNMGYIVYCFESVNSKLLIEFEKEGKSHKEKRKNLNCLLCKKLKNCVKEDKYIMAVKNLYERK